jgi:hypothetical protein
VSATVGQATDEFGRPSLRQRIGAAIFDRAVRSREERLFAKRRRRLLETARAGTGGNLPHYPRDRVCQLVLLDVHRGHAGVPVVFKKSDRRLPERCREARHMFRTWWTNPGGNRFG